MIFCMIHQVHYNVECPLIEPTETNKVQEILRKIRKMKRAITFNENMYDHLLEMNEASEADIRVTKIRGKKFPDLTYLVQDFVYDIKDGERIQFGSQMYKHDEILDLKA